MTLEEAIEMLKREYAKALKQKWIVSPLAWALYVTWKHADEHRAKRKEE